MQFCEWKVSFPVEALEPVFGLRDRGDLLVGAIGSGPAVYGGVGEVTTGNRRKNLSILAAVSKATTAGSVVTGEAIQAIKVLPFLLCPKQTAAPIRFSLDPFQLEPRRGLDKTAESDPSSERVKGLPGARARQRRDSGGAG